MVVGASIQSSLREGQARAATFSRVLSIMNDAKAQKKVVIEEAKKKCMQYIFLWRCYFFLPAIKEHFGRSVGRAERESAASCP